MNEPILEATQLNKFFRLPEPFQVLKDISLSVQKGEFITIVGKSGCGKSSLLYLLSTLDTDYTGNLSINGSKVTGLNEHDLSGFRNEHIGFVFQFHYLLPEFTVLQNIMIPAMKLGKLSRQQIEHNAMQRLEEMGIRDVALKPSGKLSGGQQQRVAIARALINNPGIIMADEPTGNLDSNNTQIIFNIFRQLAQEGNTILAVTHDKDFAARSDRIIEMMDGRIIH
ncbi:ABC transporter ATP-binding protein [Flavitalea sp. BT771]|uniref:ABC transporter ATP-binding protein n=1 Tax=Flavitalea sp. BT771 TaxID=3063329 RepID=UPI0026E1E5F0|nr:ABC transporter ATP-binding protein [Flavitalea sp. BT771]MDO6429522.1 ABC transporter ATP-binding protein [Flavitalea sp. BT771]MDV6218350.1 ABC transporter ATP-binding protein [Flavitalea sp. BT771]